MITIIIVFTSTPIYKWTTHISDINFYKIYIHIKYIFYISNLSIYKYIYLYTKIYTFSWYNHLMGKDPYTIDVCELTTMFTFMTPTLEKRGSLTKGTMNTERRVEEVEV